MKQEEYLDKLVLIKSIEEGDEDIFVLHVNNIRTKADLWLFDTSFCLKNDTSIGGYTYFKYHPSQYLMMILDCTDFWGKKYHKAYKEYLMSLPIEYSTCLFVSSRGELIEKD